MTDNAGESVQHLFLVLRGVIVPVFMSEMSPVMGMFMRMVCHFLHLLANIWVYYNILCRFFMCYRLPLCSLSGSSRLFPSSSSLSRNI